MMTIIIHLVFYSCRVKSVLKTAADDDTKDWHHVLRLFKVFRQEWQVMGVCMDMKRDRFVGYVNINKE